MQSLSNSCFKWIITFIFGILLLPVMKAQDGTGFWDQVRIGGGIGVTWDNDFFSGTLAPSAIYDVNDYFSVGVGVSGSYSSLRNTYKTTILGGSVISLFNVLPALQLSAEFEQLHVNRKNDSRPLLIEQSRNEFWVPALYVGAGYRAYNVTLGIRYDVLYDSTDGIYANAWAPFVRVYF